MATEWSGTTPELMMHLDRDASEFLGFQLQNAWRIAIRSGQVRMNERLRSSRKLAADLRVSRGLVQDAHEQLGAEGYLSASVGSGTRVAFASPTVRSSEPNSGRSDQLEFDFSPGRPDLNSFPMKDWLWACGEVSRTASARDAGYGDARGHRELRRVVASYFQRVRGGSTDAENVIICSGFTQGAGLVLAALLARGVTSVAVEDPGHPDIVDIVRRAGVQVVPVAVDGSGPVVDILNGTTASAVIVTAAHQTPTGVVLAPERRHALLGWAKERGGNVIEDDYDSEFRYDRQPIGALQGLSDDHVVTMAR
jgi:GntR family transcriptional regulator/MocR family aminotransferase